MANVHRSSVRCITKFYFHMYLFDLICIQLLNLSYFDLYYLKRDTLYTTTEGVYPNWSEVLVLCAELSTAG
jgi:hypothetical protein